MNQQEARLYKLTHAPVGKLIVELAIPCIISMLVTAFYNMADTFFIGMMHSNSATGAIGVSFSLMTLIQAVGYFFGHGSGNCISQELGRHEFDTATKMAATGFFSAMAGGAAICILGQIFLTPMAVFLGSTPTILPYAQKYLRIILIGAPWMTASMVLNNLLRFQGSAQYGMIGIVTGAILNIALDPLLIFVFGMGISGAAWATVIGQFVSFWVLLFSCHRGGNIAIKVSNFQFKKNYYVLIFRAGIPTFARHCLGCVATICLNQAAKAYGDAAIAAFGVVQRIALFASYSILGFGQGFQPVCGVNYGAGFYRRVRDGFYFCVRTSFAVCVILSVVGFSLAPQLIACFRDDPNVIAIGSVALRFQCMSFLLQSWIISSTMILQALNRTIPAILVAIARQGLFLIPLVWVFSSLFGMLGIQISQTVSDVFTFALSLPFQIKLLRDLAEAEKKDREK